MARKKNIQQPEGVTETDAVRKVLRQLLELLAERIVKRLRDPKEVRRSKRSSTRKN